MIRIGLIGDFSPDVKAHVAIPRAIQLAGNALGCQVACEWIPTSLLESNVDEILGNYHALWVVPASPYVSMQGAFNGIQYAREHRLPLLGTCGGLQHLVIEFARNVLGLSDADHAETNPTAATLLVAPLTCSVSELDHAFHLTPDSTVARIYGQREVVEQYGICNYGFNSEFRARFDAAGMRVVGVDTDGEVRIMELTGHPFFVGTLFQPERSAFREVVHPLIKAFVQAAVCFAATSEAQSQVSRMERLTRGEWSIVRDNLGYLPLSLASRSLSPREIVLSFPDLVEAIRLLAAQNIALLGWEIWLLYGDGRCGHSGDPSTDMSVRGAHETWPEFVHRSVRFCLDIAETNLPDLTENAERHGAECYFCLSIVAEDEF